MVATRIKSPKRWWISLGFVLIVLCQGWVHLNATNVGRPYEAWDEITLNNSAKVMSGPTFDRGFRYGSLDNFIQWAAIVTYEYFDRIGRAYPHIRYANNVPESWDNPHLAYGPKTWMPPMEYSVFRGLDDRESIFISRKIHLVVVYALVAAVGVTAVAYLEGASLHVLAALLAFTAVPVLFFQAGHALPNAINAVLSFGTLLFALFYCDSGRRGYLFASVALCALALNFKLDAILLAGAPGLALCYMLLRQPFANVLKDALLALLIGVAVLVAGKPVMLLDPIMDIRVRYHTLFMIAGGSSWAGFDMHANWQAFLQFLSSSLLWPRAGTYSGLVAAVLALLCIVGVGIRFWRSKALMLVIGAILVGIAWPAVVLRSALPEPHLLLNGLGLFLATVGFALVIAYRQGGRLRVLAHAVAVLLALSWLVRIAGLGNEAMAVTRSYAATNGLDPAHNRTKASLDIIKLAGEGYARTVLVDQHSYIDLRALRLGGLDAKLVNMNNFATVVAALPADRRYLVMFARGGFDRGDGHLRGWEGEVTPQVQQGYFAHLGRLMQLPVVRRYPGAAQPLLSVAPINPSDEIFVSILIRQKKAAPAGVRQPGD
jgi:hypothetical protein